MANEFPFKLKPGLSYYAKDPQAAANSLTSLLDKAESVVPLDLRSKTAVRVGATAGLRALGGEAFDKICNRELLKSRSTLKSEANGVKILDGSQEVLGLEMLSMVVPDAPIEESAGVSLGEFGEGDISRQQLVDLWGVCSMEQPSLGDGQERPFEQISTKINYVKFRKALTNGSLVSTALNTLFPISLSYPEKLMDFLVTLDPALTMKLTQAD
ncbi:hypothetical protein GOBAR_AA28093 [Gossypium barbadense]|uniref:apyrase n=1 Tax=Gossypium barbadense TaxID=3634 RepID=A0A2P5WNB1_GOSBA|nr:hypothetical protein GOBAR_AA28093 [Gossypium barbadense]